MHDEVLGAALGIAEALTASERPVGARWRWGTVTADNGDGTLDVEVEGAVLSGVLAAAGIYAPVGARVRVSYLGTDAVIDASTSADEYPYGSIGGTGTNQFYARNGTATLMSSGTTPSAQWGSASVCTIPAGFRPKMGLYFPVQKDGATVSDTYIQFGPEGVVTIQNAGGTQAARTYRVTATWAY